MTARSPWRRTAATIAAALILPTAAPTAGAAENTGSLAPVSDSLRSLLSSVSGGKQLTAMVHGTDLAAAK